ncbi:uncharacterized protein TRUGW13939_07963 [Talaromyces rugulosus]|uniref:Fork-head domain-containing protein n=1 Tax=Talaromyces rugulosus TaxID=121627 RepID=A0A7H8R3M7_TALRU|nr:uncharacterized protein TRUGW13939_07963 [Talaromyces rugulosus]QKX60817.1 hypothetical protein TRUGW13939_07963 [Talaromyces rugulosus]
MASTRHQSISDSHPPPPPSDREGKAKQPASLQPSPMPLNPIPNLHTAAAGDCILNPSSGAAHGASPVKGTHRPKSSGAGQARLSAVSLTAPVPPIFPTDSPIKRPTYGHSHQRSPSLPLQAAFTTFPSAPSSFQPRFNTIMNNDGFADFPDPTYQVKSLKRTFMETVPGKDRSSKKQKREESVVCSLPDPEDMPPVEDDGSKPPCSYATLIGMAILRAPGRKLTLAQIYKWISDTFAFYRSGDSGWQNSIRHNLSLNKAFIKQERPKDDPGKGNYWAIEPGMEGQFLKDRPVRRATLASIPLPPILQREGPVFGPAIGTATWRVPPNPSSSVQVPEISKADDLSSDATIPASDPALQDDVNDDDTRAMPSHSNAPRSSPPQVIHSSPPLAPSRFLRQGTPPTPSHSTLAAAVPRSRKHASTAAVNDSGYYSSIESSAMRSNKAGHILTSDLDIEPPRIKRGRAEEEIARIRSSSHDISPSHPKILKKESVSMAGSSPFRDNYVSFLAPPLTPAIKFKKPLKPPPSLSPNTNLRNHRRKIQQMVNSPIKHLDLSNVDFPLSPNFNIHDDAATPSNSLQLHFDIFADSTADITSTPIFRSPDKRLLKSGLEDTNAFVGSPLADITSNSANKRLSRGLDSTGKGLSFQDSPSKIPQSARLSDASNDDFFSFSLFDGSPEEVDGIDLLQGFKKIGGSSKESGVRPTFNHRNHTSFF